MLKGEIKINQVYVNKEKFRNFNPLKLNCIYVIRENRLAQKSPNDRLWYGPELQNYNSKEW